jgi:hypothetical protein
MAWFLLPHGIEDSLTGLVAKLPSRMRRRMSPAFGIFHLERSFKE